MIKQTIPFDEHYYKYKEEADKVRAKYKPMEELERKEWLQLYKEIMNIITNSKDWTEWIWNSRSESGRLKNKYSTTEPFIGWLNGVPIDGVWTKKIKAARELNIPQAATSQILLGYTKQSAGYTFRYLCDMGEDEIRKELMQRGEDYDEWEDKITKL